MRKIVRDLLKRDDCKLKYYLLSEFSNQVSDIRYDVSRYMQQEINKLTQALRHDMIMVLPTEVGLTIDLLKLQVKCMACNENAETIHVMRPFGENYDIQYVCSNCIYSAGLC